MPPNCTREMQTLDQGAFSLRKQKICTILINGFMRKLVTGNSEINVLNAICTIVVCREKTSPEATETHFRCTRFQRIIKQYEEEKL
jgi:hypothetical protein